MFRGKFIHTIDPKGRLSIPSRFRDDLVARGTDTLVLTEADECLWAFPLDEWEQFEQKLRQQSQFSADVRSVVRMTVASAKDCPVDRAGRTLIPPELRQYARLNKEVVLAGTLNRFEIWDRERWDAYTERNRNGGFEQSARKLGDLGL